ncbi:hypothetical protein [Peribacillus muralis]|uniref:hypothetical protein n=1 Tax=Peribacillus muralis TaxID=264697 RepID=UPI003CFBCCC0
MDTYVVRDFKVNKTIGGSEVDTTTIGIGIRSRKTKNIIPSPLTNFIKTMYRNKGKSLSSQRNCAYAVTRFLTTL